MCVQMKNAIGAAMLFSVLSVTSVRADQNDPLLEPLLQALAQNDDAAEAQRLTERIVRIWRDPNSPSIELLMARARLALDGQDYDLALRHLDDVVGLAPDYAEGWFVRASLYVLTDRYDQAVLDFERVVRMEEHHFNAWAGLGQIYVEIGSNGRALSAYRRALESNPFQKGVLEIVSRLEKEVEGQGI